MRGTQTGSRQDTTALLWEEMSQYSCTVTDSEVTTSGDLAPCGTFSDVAVLATFIASVFVLDARGEAAAFWACHLTHAIPVGRCDCCSCHGPALCNPGRRASSDSASLDSVVAPYFGNSGGRASPANFSTAVAAPLVIPFAWDSEDPSSPDGLASSDSVVALCFAIP